jgi:hypothetical protein
MSISIEVRPKVTGVNKLEKKAGVNTFAICVRAPEIKDAFMSPSILVCAWVSNR